MPVKVFNVVAELRKLARGQKTKVPVDGLARVAADKLAAFTKRKK